MKLCGIIEGSIPCRNEATCNHGSLEVCTSHLRILTGNRFGQRYSPPWTKQEAFEALVKDGSTEEIARKQVDEFFGSRESAI